MRTKKAAKLVICERCGRRDDTQSPCAPCYTTMQLLLLEPEPVPAEDTTAAITQRDRIRRLYKHI